MSCRHGQWGYCDICEEIDRAWDAASIAKSKRDKDAARYEWLRSEEVATDPIYYAFWDEFYAKLVRLDRMDALIDKWMDGAPVRP